MTHAESISIGRRFRGPPDSGNGGYVCGLLGRCFAQAATVRLLASPPLETRLQLQKDGNGVQLLLDSRVIAQARPTTLELEVPEAPTLVEAQTAGERFAGFAAHPFPGCFVCGPARTEGDGLRIFPGPVAGRDVVAAVWTPSPDLADEHGQLHTEFVWSGLDCTGFFSFGPLPDGAPALLGELTVRIDAPATAATPLVVMGWSLGNAGRKRFAGSALCDGNGKPLAIARATWIVMPPGSAGAC